MTLLCLAAAGAVLALPLPGDGFELRWVHSVERIEWHEQWQAAPDGGGLRLVESRVQGSGAGMEPPEGAVLSDGWWINRTADVTVPALHLALSPFTAPYTLCLDGTCQDLNALLPDGAESVTIAPCSP